MKYHPDRNPTPGTSKVFTAITEAYKTLIDPDRRRSYDDRLQFYKPFAGERAEERVRYTSAVSKDEGPATRSFAALHLVGLLFGSLVAICSLIGIVLNGWPLYSFLFCTPAMLVIPDSYSGLRRAIRSWS